MCDSIVMENNDSTNLCDTSSLSVNAVELNSTEQGLGGVELRISGAPTFWAKSLFVL